MVEVSARAPGKVNIQLAVGRVRPDGFHPLASVFHAVELSELVTVRTAPPGSGIRILAVRPVGGIDVSAVPTDATNLVHRAARLVAKTLGEPADVEIEIDKAIPVAGGMAGGSADAAAALVACNALWRGGLDPRELAELGLQLGSDVPFALLGGTAAGLGRGEHLSTLMTRGRFHWVFATSTEGLSTPAVYRKFDDQTAGTEVPEPVISQAVTAALIAGDARKLGRALANDLQGPALALRPQLRAALDAGVELGALGGIVSGSGPTLAFLAANAERALDLAVSLTGTGLVAGVMATSGPAPGARVVVE